MNLLPAAWQAYDHDLYAVLAVLGTGAAVGLTHALMARSRWVPWVQSLRGVVPPFINIIGVLFALTLAFLANDTWSAHDRATAAVFREADALRALVIVSDRLPEPLRAEVRSSIKAYALASAAEWPQLAQRQASPEVARLADALLGHLTSREVGQNVGESVHALMLRKAVDIRDERDLRVGLSQTHVNPLKWLGMAFLGLVTLLSVAVVHADAPRPALVALTLFALASAPTAAIVLVQGNPFQPPTSVSPEPIRSAVAGL